ncbi:hypothetical protein [Acinetobacter sp. YH01021]|uniref:hypothetical protein n=1 Tax=Acinetobacter sp. YH01021 TaxID=2601035 RepID=UPI0015D3D6CD|nr:hypothetical protein [Acinetobacter sp. YH01021]
MRKRITHIGAIASRSAHRLYDTNLKPFADAIKQQEGKEVFASTVMLRASADLFHLLGNGYEEQLDMLVGIMKEQAKNARNEG